MLNWNQFFKNNHKKLLLICFIIFIFFSSFHLNELFMEDEICFVGAGEAVAETGRPVFYQGEQNAENIAAWHPPLNVYLVGFAFYVAGDGEVQARSLTMLIVASIIFIVYLIALQIFRDLENKYTIAVVSSYIFALNPLTIQSGLMVDIDTGILMFLMSVFILLFLKWKQDLTFVKIIMLGLAFSVLLWAKLTTPPLLLIAIFFYYALDRNFKKAVLVPVITGLLGLAVFSGSWWLFARAVDIPFDMPYTWSTGSNFGFRSNEPRYILYVIGGRLKLFIFWITPFMIFFAQHSLRKRLGLFRKKKRLEEIDLLVIISLLIFVQYTIAVSISYYYPKYYVPMLPFLAVVVAHAICQYDYFDHRTYSPEKKKKRRTDKGNKDHTEGIQDETSKKIFLTFILVLVISLILMILLLGDPDMSRDRYNESFLVLARYITVFFISMFVLILMYKAYSKLNISLNKAFFITVILCLASSTVYINTIQVNADYSVRYNYGEEGMVEVIDFIKANTNDTSVMIAPKDVGYYSGIRYYETYGGFMQSWDSINESIREHNITYIVLRREAAFGLSDLSDEVKMNIERLYIEIEGYDFGDFIVFHRRPE